MSKIKELKKRYPYHKILYEPQEGCRACNGTGEHKNGRKEMTLCVCTCVGFGDIGGIFRDHIAKMKREML